MKKVIYLLLTTTIINANANTNECKTIEIDFIKEKKVTRISTKINGKLSYSHQTPTFSKKIFKTKLIEMKIENKKLKKYRFKKIKPLNEKEINLKWSLFENELNIYAPQKEVIEKFKFEGCL